jgi:hypothetical protein
MCLDEDGQPAFLVITLRSGTSMLVWRLTFITKTPAGYAFGV